MDVPGVALTIPCSHWLTKKLLCIYFHMPSCHGLSTRHSRINHSIVTDVSKNIMIRLFLHRSLLGSGIVSTSLQCGDVLCDTTRSNLSNPVVITIEHSKVC